MDGKRTVLITGAAGFIGFHLARRLLDAGETVYGLDNLNDYYEVSLKESRLSVLNTYDNFTFLFGDISDEKTVAEAFGAAHPDVVVHLAAQAGVRYSIDHPRAYIDANVIGFFNLLEAARHHPLSHFVYASSSSVYGNQEKTPFSISDRVDQPVSLYAATKRADELFAYAYAHLYGIPMTGLRFFTVYGPFGRPDMAYFKFAKKIYSGEPIELYNHGDMKRDFTYIDDIVTGVVRVMDRVPAPDENGAKSALYNIGNNSPENLMDFVRALEKALGRSANMRFLPMQPGDVYQTYADVSALRQDVGFVPDTPVEDGLAAFADWFKSYYRLDK